MATYGIIWTLGWRCFSWLAGEIYGLVVSGLGVGRDGCVEEVIVGVVGDLGGMVYPSKLAFEMALGKLG